jgi:argininosuccinate lyase
MIARRSSFGGTAPKRVQTAIKKAQKQLAKHLQKIRS